MLATLLAVLNPGDEVIIFEPFYENYGPGLHHRPGPSPSMCRSSRRTSASIPTGCARAVIAAHPGHHLQQPEQSHGQGLLAGRAPDRSPTCAIEHDLLAITDEIYEHILYDGASHTPIATLPGMADRTITISGISKSYSVTGWRVGYAVASPELSLGIRRAHDFITVGAPHPLQEAAVTALEPAR